MRSSLVKHIWLIQPNEAPSSVLPIDAAGGFTARFAPAWAVLCLHAYLIQRTGHTCEFIDVRLHDSLDQAFASRERPTKAATPSLALIYTHTHQLGSIRDIAGHLRQKFPLLAIALYGPHIVSFPETLAFFPEIDYGLRGDPEFILRLLLDGLEIPHRLKMVPGLVVRGGAIKPAHWLPDLKSLSFPEWDRMHWSAYENGHIARGARAEARLSRGHPGTSFDVAWPGAGEPIREWPMPRMAQLLQKCSGNGIAEVFFADPPGFWTDHQLAEWCRHLRALRNTQAWSFQIIPRELPDEIITELFLNGCRRIELVMPTLDAATRPMFGMTLTDAQLKSLVAQLKNGNIEPQIIYWIEPPLGEPGDAASILRHLKQLGQPGFAVYPFPLYHDAPLFGLVWDKGLQPPAMPEWLEWATRKDRGEPPADVWTGGGGVKRARHTLARLHRTMARDPMRMLRKLFPPRHRPPAPGGPDGWAEKFLRLFKRNDPPKM